MGDNNEYNPVLTRPNRLELFTYVECEKILNNLLADTQQTGKLVEFKIVPATEHVGFLGEYFHLYLTYQVENETEEKSTRLFVKSVIFKNADMSYYMEKMGILQKEVHLYEQLINKLKSFSKHIWCGKCYFTRDDLFVMQNVEDLGYAPLSLATRFLDEEHLKPLLKALAILHASSVAYERKNKVSIGVELREWLKEKSIDPDVEWCTTGLDAVLAVTATHPKIRNDAQAQEYVVNELPRVLDNVYYMVNSSPLHRNVFLHRDAWSANVFYHKTRPFEESCVLVDFQLCRYGPPALDFLMATYLNAEPSNRKKMMGRMITQYYNSLSDELKDLGINAEKEQLSRQEFEQSLKDFALFGATYNCIAATILHLPDNYLKKLKEERPADFHRFCNVDRRKDVLNLMNDHEAYSNYMYECIDDLLELTYYKSSKIL
ncbi:uncharacterized protein Dwil_GK14563 [Drosophila willistoni]|uniref:CHK kinase-like domain-containing protein n=1 Tax=Drosophila willistoni TaxID=7260 RepID=B4MWY7_DROWI|nr:uncharacterized protein Dwil_GK14563 [Drosophila willistoni]